MRSSNDEGAASRTLRGVVLAASLVAWPQAATGQLMIVGNDEKVRWDATGAAVFSAPGNDTVSIIDVATDPAAPRIVASLPLMNSVFGPPMNLAITPDSRLAIVTNAMAWTRDGSAWTSSPDDKVHVIDLTASPPQTIGTVQVGKQPSGLSINARETSPSWPTARTTRSASCRSPEPT